MERHTLIDTFPNNDRMIGLIDADIIAYRCAAAGEEDELPEVLVAVDNFIREIYRKTRFTRYIHFLTGSNNFRMDVGVTKPYKGNRKDTVRPRHLQGVRDFLMQEFNAMMVDGYEADDALASARYRYGNENSVIMTIDKDLYQVPGYHYNFVKQERYQVSEEQATYNLWKQVVTGDSTDNIPGLPKVGPAKYDKAIVPHKTYAEIAWGLYEDKGADRELFNEQTDLIRMRADLQWLPYEDHFTYDNYRHIEDHDGFDEEEDKTEGFDL